MPENTVSREEARFDGCAPALLSYPMISSDMITSPQMMINDQKLERILAGARTIALVGASPNPARPSNIVARYLIEQGYIVFPVRPGRKHILNLPCFNNLADIPVDIDIVDVFRKPEACPGIAREAVAVGARVLWLQQGIASEESARIAEEGGLEVIMNRCIKTVHRGLEIAVIDRDGGQR